MGVPPMNKNDGHELAPAQAGDARATAVKDPRGPAEGRERVIRGGAWNSSAGSCRSAYRTSSLSIDDTCLADDAIGFRCVRNAPAPSSMGGFPNAKYRVWGPCPAHE